MNGIVDFDWNFEAVPDAELVACCYWEYARESAFLRDLKLRWDAWGGCGRCPEDLARGINRIQQAPPHVFVRLQAILAEDKFPGPWQKLPKKHRRNLIEFDLGLPLPFARGGDLSEAERALERAQRQIRKQHAAVQKVHEAWPGYGEGTLRRWGKWPKSKPLPRVFWEEGYESLIVRIAWKAYTNEQIIESFRCWVKANRPKIFPVPSGKGHKQLSQRVALERLGILRLLHRFSLHELRKQNPAAWKRYDNANRRWPKEAQRAVTEFARLFPKLEIETPLSWPPKSNSPAK
jgi:hypothetical protein